MNPPSNQDRNRDLEREKCREAALALLDRRSYTAARLAAKLRAKKYPPAVIEGVLADLEQAGLVDDHAYARAYIASRLLPGAAPVGRRRLAAALRSQGIAAAVIEKALAEVRQEETEETEIERARRAARRKWPQILRACPGNPGKARARLWRFLAGRGFEPEAIRAAVDEVTAGP